jgi:hypothetical protein
MPVRFWLLTPSACRINVDAPLRKRVSGGSSPPTPTILRGVGQLVGHLIWDQVIVRVRVSPSRPFFAMWSNAGHAGSDPVGFSSSLNIAANSDVLFCLSTTVVRLTVNQEDVGSNPTGRAIFGVQASTAKRRPFKPREVGSIPTRPTIQSIPGETGITPA